MKHLLLFIGIVFFSIDVQAQVVVNENPDPLVACDGNNDGFAFFDLDQADADITLGDPSLIVLYHVTMTDAQSGDDPIISTYMNQVPYFDTVYARVENSQGDFAIVSLDLVVQELSPITPPIDLVMEDDNGDGFAIFDLTENNAIMLEGLNLSDYDIFYYQSEMDAEAGPNPLPFPMSYHNIQNPQTIYVHVGNVNTGCYVLASFEILVGELPPIIQPIDLIVEDYNGDGFGIFDLTVNEAVMLEGLNPSDYNVSYYEVEADAESGAHPIPENERKTNGEDGGYPIADPTAYHNIENPQTIYVRVENINSGLFVITSFTIATETLSLDSFGFENLSVFPNPTSESFTIQSSQLGSETTVSLYDIQGRMVSSEKRVSQNGTFTINISSFENGVYFVKISSEENSVIKRLVKN